MLDVHPPNEAIHGWRDFLLHILTITIGLLIALGLEATVEALHHRGEVNETREALKKELAENHTRFANDVRFSREETTMLRSDFVVLRNLTTQPQVRSTELAGVALRSSSARMNDAIAVAYSYLSQAKHLEAIRPTELVKVNEFLTQVAAKHLRHSFLMQNLAEEYPDFRPAPTREELEAYME